MAASKPAAVPHTTCLVFKAPPPSYYTMCPLPPHASLLRHARGTHTDTRAHGLHGSFTTFPCVDSAVLGSCSRDHPLPPPRSLRRLSRFPQIPRPLSPPVSCFLLTVSLWSPVVFVGRGVRLRGLQEEPRQGGRRLLLRRLRVALLLIPPSPRSARRHH